MDVLPFGMRLLLPNQSNAIVSIFSSPLSLSGSSQSVGREGSLRAAPEGAVTEDLKDGWETIFMNHIYVR